MFETLKEYYDFINEDLSAQNQLNLSNRLTQLREKLNDGEKKIVSYEIYFSDFSFEKGKYIPLVEYTNGNCYPDLTLFEDYEYIKERAKSTDLVNSKYKAKYNHLLWESSIKHIDYAKSAINNYLEFLTKCDLSPDDNLSNHGFAQLFINLFVLAQKINYRKEDALSFLVSYIKQNNLNGFQKYSLMKFICEDGKKISPDYLNTFFDYSISVEENQIYEEFRKEFLKLLIILSKKLNKPSKDYHIMLGDVHIEESKKREGSFVVHAFYLDALKQYQLAGNKARIEEVTVLIEKAKDSLDFKTISHEESSPLLQKWFESIDKITSELIEKGESKDIYHYLMLAGNIFPKAKDLNNNVTSPIMDLVSTMNFDINRNVSSKSKSGINSYYLYIQNFSMRHLWLVFSKGITNNKINYTSLRDFLIEHTWYSTPFEEINPSGEKETYNWLDQLLPALKHYFQQSEIDLKTGVNNSKEYILSVDSMTLKFEGLLRELSRIIGAQTIDIKDDGTQERISFEKLLENDKFKALVPEDDIALFKFLFLSDGLNLRNNIAHCFYKAKNYSASLMWLLICAFLKLGNYKFNIENK